MTKEDMKVIAMYLPQFHETPENNLWWGDGFTEWVAVRNAEPLFEGHEQPNEPLNGQYYNLLNAETMKHQAEMMHKYGVDALCFYHYYFKDGRKILEKPAENLLEWKDINMPFCFSWANQQWTKSWSKFDKGNSWAQKFEKGNITANDKEQNSGILLEQKYGREREWKAHFDYLLPFFQDQRYIKIDNAPIFIFYDAFMIPCLYAMIDYWKKLARENGFPDIYIIEENTIIPSANSNAILLHAPKISRKDSMRIAGIYTHSYKTMWEKILSQEVFDKTTYAEGFVGFDNTPRNAKNGDVVVGANPVLFEDCLYRLLKKNYTNNCSITFINAWNEWGEGMYLEPDIQNAFSYLEAVQNAKKRFAEDLDFIQNHYNDMDVQRVSEQMKQRMHKKTINLLDRWLSLKENGINPATFLEKQGYRSVAIYGLGVFGRQLVTEIEKTDVTIAYIVDKNSDIETKYEIKSVDTTLEEVDAIVISVHSDFNNMYKDLRKKVTCPILSIEELLYEI